jgi:hypothetical protein
LEWLEILLALFLALFWPTHREPGVGYHNIGSLNSLFQA